MSLGSSPLTRGAPRTLASISAGRRLIPAHAGSTSDQDGSLGLSKAHPRSRGEHRGLGVCESLGGGSSPLTRGALHRLPHRRADDRLIPAHAGSTQSGHAILLKQKAHPRSRGEHSSPAAWMVRNVGSSPLTRGALVHSASPLLPRRLIPAHAGSTQHCWKDSLSEEAHPRSRGEHVFSATFRTQTGGSSPLTRGAHAHHILAASSLGLIPAHAGSTN